MSRLFQAETIQNQTNSLEQLREEMQSIEQPSMQNLINQPLNSGGGEDNFQYPVNSIQEDRPQSPAYSPEQ